MMRCAAAAILLFLLLRSDVAATQPVPRWTTLEKAQQEVAGGDQIVFVFIEAPWCALCKRMKREVFPQDDVREIMDARFVSASVDLESSEPLAFNGEKLDVLDFAKQMRVRATPTMIFVRADGAILGRYEGYLGTTDFLALLDYVASDLADTLSFDEFLRSRRQ